MTRYFLHLRDGVDQLLDEEGSDYPDTAALKKAVLHAARDTMSHEVLDGHLNLRPHIDAEDGAGAIVHRLDFTDAITLIYPD